MDVVEWSHKAHELFLAGVQAAHPTQLFREAVLPPFPRGEAIGLVATGKAAVAMVRAAAERLREEGVPLHAAEVVGHAPLKHPLDPPIVFVQGNHPYPGAESAAAAEALGAAIDRWPPTLPVWLLVSGGTTSVLAAPLPPADLPTVRLLWKAAESAGIPIGRLNDLRGRLLRFGAGRLAHAILPRPLYQGLLSDVLGNDPREIGSGPGVPFPSDAGPALALLKELNLPIVAYRALSETLERHPVPPGLAADPPLLLGDNETAQRGAAVWARAQGWEVVEAGGTIQGEASAAGREFARALVAIPPSTVPRVILRGGETTVSLGTTRAQGLGGRNQEAALAAAELLALSGPNGRIVLCAGTDGRDGSTDVAGAIVHGGSWEEMQRTGCDPALTLQAHRSYAPLEAIGALLRTGPTGTNVMDLWVGIVPPQGESNGGGS